MVCRGRHYLHAMDFFDWVILIDCVSIVTIVGLILALSLSWRAEQSDPDSAPVIRDLVSAFGRGIFGYLPIRRVNVLVSSERRRLKRFSRSVRTRIGGAVVPDAEAGRAVGALPDVAAAE